MTLSVQSVPAIPAVTPYTLHLELNFRARLCDCPFHQIFERERKTTQRIFERLDEVGIQGFLIPNGHALSYLTHPEIERYPRTERAQLLFCGPILNVLDSNLALRSQVRKVVCLTLP